MLLTDRQTDRQTDKRGQSHKPPPSSEVNKQKTTQAPTVSSRRQDDSYTVQYNHDRLCHCQTTTGKVQSSAGDGKVHLDSASSPTRL